LTIIITVIGAFGLIFGLQVGERMNKSFGEIALIFLESGIFGGKSIEFYILNFELESAARNAWDVNIEISLHCHNKIIEKQNQAINYL